MAKEIPDAVENLWCNIADTPSDDLTPVMKKALPFIRNALQQEGKRVLVHCSRGQSRSGSVVIAYLMEHYNIGFYKALDMARERRRGVNPNSGFRSQLYESECRGGWGLDTTDGKSPSLKRQKVS